ncbi:SRPBCC family protein [Nonomuraea rhizosphaerae]|uniref:SRPBCC family protein n=1 Tax=Nonomuraea rhizosphaerae TaxID=2665663 RepID=UPI001C5EF336|nr:SRPBCC family protein [Nonomuraea rhizosphaerae]
MTTLTSVRTVSADPALAARIFLDWSQDPRWRDQVRRMTVEPAGPAVTGQRIVEELSFAGLTFVTPTRVEHADGAEARYRGGSGVVSVRGSRAVTTVSPGSSGSPDLPGSPREVRLTATLDVSLRGPLRPLTALLAPSYRRLQEADLDRLAELIVLLDGRSREGSAPRATG